MPLIVLPKSCSRRWGPCPPPPSLVWADCFLSFFLSEILSSLTRCVLPPYVSSSFRSVRQSTPFVFFPCAQTSSSSLKFFLMLRCETFAPNV